MQTLMMYLSCLLFVWSDLVQVALSYGHERRSQQRSSHAPRMRGPALPHHADAWRPMIHFITELIGHRMIF